jgi:phage-related protein
MKKIIYLGNTHKELEKFSSSAKQRVVTTLTALSAGLYLNPTAFKYIQTVGVGVYELRVKVEKQYRVFYVSKFPEAIYVLHAFVKKTRETSQQDVDLGIARYKALLNERQRLKL